MVEADGARGRPLPYMALHNFTGFDAQVSNEFPTVVGTQFFDASVTHTGSGASLRLDTADGGGLGSARTVAMRVATASSGVNLALANAYVTFYFRLTTSTNATTRICYEESGNCSLRLKSDDTLAIFAGSTQQAASSAISKNVWHRIDVRFQRSTTGNYELKIDGVSVLSGTANFGSGANVTGIIFGCGDAITTGKYWIDDAFIEDSAYTTAEAVAMLQPNGAGFYSGFPTGAYTDIDDAPPYSNADYIETTSDQASTYTLTDMPGGTPVAVIGKYAAQRTSGSGTCNTQVRIRSNGTNSDATALSLVGVEVHRGALFLTDPSGGGAWTKARVDALEAGIVLGGGGTKTFRVYMLVVHVAYSLSQSLTLSGIGSDEAFGNATVINRQILSPSGIATTEVFGAPTIINRQILTAVAIGSLEAFGSPSVLPGLVTLLAAAIASGEAFGSQTLTVLNPPQNVLPGGIGSDESFGTPTIQPGAAIIATPSIASAEEFGAAAIVVGLVALLAIGIPSDEAFGDATINPGSVTILPSSVPSDEAFGTQELRQAVALLPPGITSDELFGDPTLNVGATTIIAGSINSAEMFGSPTVQPGPVTIIAQAIASLEAFGLPVLLVGVAQILPPSIDSAEAFGAPTIAPGVVALLISGISSGETFGAPAVSSGAVIIVPNSITSEEAFGLSTIIPGAVTIFVTSIGSTEVFGSPSLTIGAVVVLPPAIPSDEAFGEAMVAPGAVVVLPAGISSGETFGAPAVSTRFQIDAVAIPSAEAFGVDVLVPGAVTVQAESIDSAEAFGLPFANAIQVLFVESIESGESFGVAVIEAIGFPGALVFIGDQLVYVIAAGTLILTDLSMGNFSPVRINSGTRLQKGQQ